MQKDLIIGRMKQKYLYINFPIKQWKPSILLLLSGCLLLFSLMACIDQIELDIDPDENPEQLVVDGLITVGEGPFTIRIFKTSSINYSIFYQF